MKWNEFYWIPERWSIVGIVILGLVFLKKSVLSRPKEIREAILTHERIHVRQWLETGLLLFPVWYLIEFGFRYIQHKDWDRAYRNISFEREAYYYERHHDYLSVRRFWNWINFL